MAYRRSVDVVTLAAPIAVNRSGEFYLSNTVLHERFVLRVAIGNLRTTSEYVERLWELVVEKSRSLGD